MKTTRTPASERLSYDAERLLVGLEYARPVKNPGLVLVGGLPGTGKSHLSRLLAQRVPVTVIESDAMRRILFPRPAYSAAENARLFGAIHEVTGYLLAWNRCVLLDATTLRAAHRQPLYSIADEHRAWSTVVFTSASPGLVKRRLEQRNRRTSRSDSSDADWRVYLRMRRSVEPVRRPHFIIDTSRDIMPVVERLTREVEDRLDE